MAINIEVDETNIKDVIQALKDMLNDIDDNVEKIMTEIATDGKNYLDEKYDDRVLDPNITEIFTNSTSTRNSCEIVSSGKDVVYEEFGTGDKGEDNPHPVKSNYNLKGYNTGEWIMDTADNSSPRLVEFLATQGIYSGKYWRYRKDGTYYYTQGVPAGQEMWDTRNYLINEAIPKISKKRSEHICEKFKNTIKK